MDTVSLMDQLLDRFTTALSRLVAEAHSFVRPVEPLLDRFTQAFSRLMAEALGFVKQIGSLIDKFSQFLSSLLVETLSFLSPVDTQLYVVMLGGLALTVLLLLLALIRGRRTNAHASKAFGREITFEDISAETANSAAATATETSASQVEPVSPTTANTADNPNEDAGAQPNGFTFFKRKSGNSDCVAKTTLSDKSSSEEVYTSNDGSTVISEDSVLASLEQEMLATRQLYLDGTISKEVYVSETRVLYHKAKSHMT